MFINETACMLHSNCTPIRGLVKSVLTRIMMKHNSAVIINLVLILQSPPRSALGVNDQNGRQSPVRRNRNTNPHRSLPFTHKNNNYWKFLIVSEFWFNRVIINNQWSVRMKPSVGHLLLLYVGSQTQQEQEKNQTSLCPVTQSSDQTHTETQGPCHRVLTGEDLCQLSPRDHSWRTEANRRKLQFLTLNLDRLELLWKDSKPLHQMQQSGLKTDQILLPCLPVGPGFCFLPHLWVVKELLACSVPRSSSFCLICPTNILPEVLLSQNAFCQILVHFVKDSVVFPLSPLWVAVFDGAIWHWALILGFI